MKKIVLIVATFIIAVTNSFGQDLTAVYKSKDAVFVDEIKMKSTRFTLEASKEEMAEIKDERQGRSPVQVEITAMARPCPHKSIFPPSPGVSRP